MIVSRFPEIAVISMARDAGFFAARWIDYYGNKLGMPNLFLILDGHDQAAPQGSGDINLIRLPRNEDKRARGDRNRARLVSSMAESLFHRYDVVIAHDIDEFLVIDPATGLSFKEFFDRPFRSASLSALGLDVGQHLTEEKPLDRGRPFLEQRGYAHVSARYTKAVVALKPLIWGSGFHRVKGKNFHIHPDLYLFHFGMVDYDASRGKMDDRSLLEAGWKGHLERRSELFDIITGSEAKEGDDFFGKARRRQSLKRPLYALNKPGMLKDKPVIKIPERFRSVL